MIEAAIVVVRLLQYTGAAILCGSSLFFVYAAPGPIEEAVQRRASESAVHLAAGVLHALGAAIWIGALFSFAMLLSGPPTANRIAQVHDSLRRFSVLGGPLVLVLVLSGLANSWYLVGVDNLGRLPIDRYGQLLTLMQSTRTCLVVIDPSGPPVARCRYSPTTEGPTSAFHPQRTSQPTVC